ncbi:uncharacterized protein L3040_000441 [Drepanopeziza brunnea f. sp. 'multigermtubi']|uniref:uncharacterized protein n=1 Tax=Drepanopeziza brunnea f. sp. 'multigermtubi' TaxID=698441 RepID=UPI002387CA11|nr:hypothetical protein L3040_000441 [Drepanopeziza brunnea f. sp. 'multigermtubi']
MQDLRDAFLPTLSQEHASAPLDNEIRNVEVQMTEDQDMDGEDVSVAAAVLDDSGPLRPLDPSIPGVIKPRPYQQEMLQESLKRNIIVAMDTGSGKTHIAVMRMQHEIERSSPNQIIWFLAPTVDLCDQQFAYIQSQITAVQSKFLRGDDGVDRWTEQTHWNAVLKNVKIVVSTYQILLDALSHGFVSMETLALIVFDEAHNCVKSHAGAKIMTNFYHGRKASNLGVPRILGLTASPVMRSDPRSLVKIEEVKLPKLVTVLYQTAPQAGSEGHTKTMKTLEDAFSNMEVTADPCQMKSFHTTATKILRDLGAWAADYYVSQVIRKLTKVANGSATHTDLSDMSKAEKLHLTKVLQQVELSQRSCLGFEDLHLLSDKVTKLIDVLLNEPASFSGIVFVQVRDLATLDRQSMKTYLTTGASDSSHPAPSDIGTPLVRARVRNISDLIDLNEQKHTLSRFKSGQINLAIATSVLEEGIDVPACNTVICFQAPANIKSFVQRRGRARHRDSRLVLLSDYADGKVVEWKKLEEDMRKMYEDERRTLQSLLLAEDSEEDDGRVFRVETTGALLDMDNAVAHLYHFCAKIPQSAYVDRRPEFTCCEESGLSRAEVVLPLSVDQTVRVAQSLRPWQSEKNAIKDAAFQAYIALYKAGLVNDNLLPNLGIDIVPHDLRSSANGDSRASLEKVKEQYNPWRDFAYAWRSAEKWYQYTVRYQDLDFAMLVPAPLAVRKIEPITLYWDRTTAFNLHFNSNSYPAIPEALPIGTEHTWALLKSAFGSRFQVEKKPFALQFVVDYGTPLIDLMGVKDTQPYELGPSSGLIRDKDDRNVAYLFQELLPGKPDINLVQKPYQDYEDSTDSPHVSVTRLPSRSDFFRKPPPTNDAPSKKPYSTVLPLTRCTEDKMPRILYQFGRFIPSIMYRLEKSFLATLLTKTILKDIQIQDLNGIVTAITASSASDESHYENIKYEANYQRLEFLGDTILKMCTSIQLMAQYPLWHEGYLTELKGRIVSNSCLYAAAIENGLDRFIITKKFSGHKWRPTYVDDLLAMGTDHVDKPRTMSSKIPADVVEALIGACYEDGEMGFEKPLQCLKIFIPRIDWQPLAQSQSLLFQRAPNVELPQTLRILEDMLGYEFNNKGLLVEAVTHASYNLGSASLERLEFLGDAILDYLVVERLMQTEDGTFISHVKMHLIRTALVNADILAFLCMEFHTTQEVIDLEIQPDGGSPQERPKMATLPLWKFMRHTSSAIAAEQQVAAELHDLLAPKIRDVFDSGKNYPWALLARQQAPKFFSDLVESLIGALYVDSGLDACRQFLERLKIWSIYRRLRFGAMEVYNPKEELGILAAAERVEYKLSTAPDTPEGEESRGLVCRVFVGEREIACVQDGVSRIEIETRGAEEAVRILRAERPGDISGVEQDVDLPELTEGDVVMAGTDS